MILLSLFFDSLLAYLIFTLFTNMSSSSLIFIRETNGLAFQCPYKQFQLVSQLLKETLKKQLPSRLRALSKGRLLEMDQTVKQNNLKPNQIIHLLTLSREEQQNGYIYLSFEDKIFKIYFQIQQSVRDLKNRIKLETTIQVSQQILLFNSIQLENSKTLKDYEIRNGDFLCMAKIKEIKPHILDLPQFTFPKKKSLDKRRGSQCINTKNEQQKVSAKKIPKYEIQNENITNKNTLISSCKTPQQNYLCFGPSPLSEYDNSFRNCMDQWMKDQPQTISEHFLQQSYWNQTGSAIKNSVQQDNKNLKDTEDLTRGIPCSYFEQKKELCQSEVFGEQNSQPSSLVMVQMHKNHPSKIIPKIVYSTEIESPTKRLEKSEEKAK